MVKIDYRDGRPIYEQVADGIEELALRGALPAETQLPSVRQFAMELSINPNTIQRAYGELERRGVIRREAHPTDRRRKRIRLTETGRAFANEVSTEVNAIEVEAMSQLPAAEQRAFVELSRKFYDALKTAGEQFRQKEAAAAKA